MNSTQPNPLDFLSIGELENSAEACMDRMAYEYLSSGAADEITVRWNRERYDDIALRPRMLRDIPSADTRTTLFGVELPSPILLSPVAYHGILHPEAEIATARGAEESGTPFIVSTNTNTAFESIAAATSAPLWFQLYVQSDREFTGELVKQVQAAGCKALVVTVDTPTTGARNRQVRARFELPPGLTTPHLHDLNFGKRAILTPSRTPLTWKGVSWLRSITSCPLILKGILDPDDAELAVESGADAVFVSNHGGRNLDTAPASIDALPFIAERVNGRIPVLVDGGIRRGTDILKALAFGATAVGIGRPYGYGLAAAGSAGVARVVSILREELEMAMLLSGVGSTKSIDSSVLWNPITTRSS
jgi:4-hydroxymandelate oxidase